jgi:hypothetical protein
MSNTNHAAPLSSLDGQQDQMSEICTGVLVTTTFLVILVAFANLPLTFYQELRQIAGLRVLHILLTLAMSLAYALVALFLLERGQSETMAKIESVVVD